MVRPFRCLLAAVGAALVALGAGGARAAPPEVFSLLALHPSDPSRLLLAYVQGGQGLLFSDDGGLSFALRCGAAVSASFTKSRAPLLVTGDGTALLGTFEGLVEGRADGCGFGDVPEVSGMQVADLAAHPSDPAVVFLATANAIDGARTGLVRRNADGSFTELGGDDTQSATGAGAALNRLAVVALPGGGLRFIASALVTAGSGEARAVVRHSDDEGGSWHDHEVAGAGDARLLLLAVDPTNPERIAVALSRDGDRDDVLVSLDGGQSFQLVLELFEVGATALAPDGRFWLGDAGGDAEYSQPGRLYRFDDLASAPVEIGRYPVRCLGYRALDGGLFGCQRDTFGRIDPDSGEFSPTAGFTTVASFVSCEAEALASVCKPQLCNNWCGVLHYASAPVCDTYSELEPLCGSPARAYEREFAGAEGSPALPVAPAGSDLGAPRSPLSPSEPAPPSEPALAAPTGPSAPPAACQLSAAGVHLAPGWGPAQRSWAVLVGLFSLLALGLRRLGTRARSRAQQRCRPRSLSAICRRPAATSERKERKSCSMIRVSSRTVRASYGSVSPASVLLARRAALPSNQRRSCGRLDRLRR
jgi:hypothetical protein